MIPFHRVCFTVFCVFCIFELFFCSRLHTNSNSTLFCVFLPFILVFFYQYITECPSVASSWSQWHWQFVTICLFEIVFLFCVDFNCFDIISFAHKFESFHKIKQHFIHDLIPCYDWIILFMFFCTTNYQILISTVLFPFFDALFFQLFVCCDNHSLIHLVFILTFICFVFSFSDHDISKFYL